MARTFLQLQEEVLEHGFNANRYRERVKAWLNEAHKIAVRKVRGASQQATDEVTLVAGTRGYALPADLGRIESVRLGTSFLSALDSREFDSGSATDEGDPLGYFLEGDELVLYPTPRSADTVTIRYWRTAPDLDDDTDTTLVPDEFEDALVAYALHKAYRSEDDFDAADYHKRDWREALALMDSELSYRDEGLVTRVGDRRPDLGGATSPRFRRP